MNEIGRITELEKETMNLRTQLNVLLHILIAKEVVSSSEWSEILGAFNRESGERLTIRLKEIKEKYKK